MSTRCQRVAHARAFQNLISGVIVLNALVLGIQTYEIPTALDSALSVADTVFLAVFVPHSS